MLFRSTNTPSDRVIWIPIEGIFRMTGHVLRGTGEQFTADAAAAIPDAHKEVSAVMLKLKSPQVGWQLDQMINKQGKVATLAHPIGTVMLDLNPVGPAATDGDGKPPQRGTRAAAGVQQPYDTAMRSGGRADERRHAFDDRRRSWIELRFRDALKACHAGLRALSVKRRVVG